MDDLIPIPHSLEHWYVRIVMLASVLQYLLPPPSDVTWKPYTLFCQLVGKLSALPRVPWPKTGTTTQLPPPAAPPATKP